MYIFYNITANLMETDHNTMFFNELNSKIFDENVSTDNYAYSYEPNSICSICGGSYKRAYITYLHDIKTKTKTCYLCNSVCNFKNFHTSKCFVVISDIKQSDINKMVLDGFMDKDRILFPNEIDPDCKILNISSHRFVRLYNKMTALDKQEFKSFKIMYTGEIYGMLEENSPSYFNLKKKEIKVPEFNNDIFHNVVNFATDFPNNKKKFDNYDQQYINDEHSAIREIKSSLVNKQQFTSNIAELLN